MKLIVFLAVLCALTFVVLAQNNNNKGKKNKGGKQDGGGKNNKGGKQAQSNKKDQKNEAQKKAAKHSGKSGGSQSARFGYYAAYDDYGRDEDYLAQSPDEYGDGKGGHHDSSSEEAIYKVYDDMNYDDENCDGFNYYSNGPQMMWAFFFPISMMPGYYPYGGGYMMSPYGSPFGSPIMAVMPPPFGRPPMPPPAAYGRFDYDEYDNYGSQKKIKSGKVGKSDQKKKNPASAQELKRKPTPFTTTTTKKAAKKNNGKKG